MRNFIAWGVLATVLTIVGWAYVERNVSCHLDDPQGPWCTWHGTNPLFLSN